jgi:FtsH-binding integral membrane protein
MVLTLYAITTKTDFTTKYGVILVLFTAVLMLTFISIFTKVLFWHNLLCALGIVLFGIYIVIDTQMVVGGKRYGLGLDDWAVASLILYIDIIQVFLYILEILVRNR